MTAAGAPGVAAVPLRVLLVEDSEDDALLVVGHLEKGGYAVIHERVCAAQALRESLQRGAWDIVLSDYSMPGFSGRAALEILRQHDAELPLIIVSGAISEEIAVAAMRAGAADYVMKNNLARLIPAVERELREANLRRKGQLAKRTAEQILQGIVISAMDGIIAVTEDHRIVLFNTAAEGIFGYTRDEVMGRPLDLLLPERFRARHAEQMRRYASTGVSARGMGKAAIIPGLRASGEEFPMEAAISQIGTAPGRLLTVVVRDVTERTRAAAALERAERKYRAIFEHSVEGLFRTTPAGKVLSANPAAARMLGYASPQEVTDRISDLGEQLYVDPLDRDAFLAKLRDVGVVHAFEARFRRKGGDIIWVSVSASLETDESDGERYLLGSLQDITERKDQQEKIRRLNRVYAVLSGINTLIVRVKDRDDLFREACRIAVEEGSFVRAWVGTIDRETRRVKRAASAGVEAEVFDSVVDKLNNRSFAGRGMVARAIAAGRAVVSNDIELDPQVFDRESAMAKGSRAIAALPMTVAGEIEAVLVLHAGEVGFFNADEMRLLTELAGDIAFALEHIGKLERLDYLAYYDELTGLANRTLFQERLNEHLSEARSNGQSLALVLMNIERFKMVNDALGRQAGDEFLRQIARRLVEVVKEPGRLGRLGGDGFAIMSLNLKGAEEMARRTEARIVELFGEPFLVAGTELRAAARFGIAMFPDDGADAETLFRNAEAALKKARATGERYLFYTQKMTQRVSERLSLENKLRQAIEKQEFVLHYQPKVDLDTRAVTGVEALIRWQSPELGLVPPVKFIPLLEETGLILPVGAWALQQSVRDHKEWVTQGLIAPRVAVNVSPIQLRRADFVATLEKAITAGASPHGLDLEITESLIMEDIEGCIEKLKAARALGVMVSIDDFGTGYSSLAYLARLPVQTLKVDRAFITTMMQDPNVMTLVSTMISLAHSLGLKVVAEGVEEEDQAKMLRLLRCEQMQGYLFSKPLPAAELTKLLQKPA